VIIVAAVVTAVIMNFVIPQFKELFTSFGADLPAFTLLVIPFRISCRNGGG
jgi:type IV pilus assembly protein PilC